MYYKNKQRLNYLLIGMAAIILSATGYFLFQSYVKYVGEAPTSPYLKVGEETIYQSDYKVEVGDYPLEIDNKAKEAIRKKMIEDSIVLQGGQTEGLIHLTTEVYNSPNKNYTKRLSLVNEIKSKIADRQEITTVGVYAIWFYNVEPAAVGVKKGKEIAFQKLSDIHEQLKLEKIDTKKAADLIKNDGSLIQLDKAYASNAYTELKVTPNDPITFDQEFDSKVRTLHTGEITDVHLAHYAYKKGEAPSEVAYVIAKVLDKKVGASSSLEDWISNYKKNYEVHLL